MINEPDLSISVIVPLLNATKWIKQCLLNLNDLIKETDYPIEVLLVDNGSSDDTYAILQEIVLNDPNFRILRSKEKGIINALNTGVFQAKNTWIMRHDCDDLSSPKRVAVFQNTLSRLDSIIYEKIALVTSRSLLSNSKDLIIGQGPQLHGYVKLKDLVKDTSPFIHGSVFLKTSIIQKMGGYPNEMMYAEDFALWRRLSKTDFYAFGLEEYLYWYRFHSTSISSQCSNQQICSVEKILNIRKSRCWTYFERGVIRRLIWEKNRKEAIIFAKKTFKLDIPSKSDIFQIIRLILGDIVDLLRGRMILYRSEDVRSFQNYANKIRLQSKYLKYFTRFK